MKKRFAISLVATALLSIAGAGTAQADAPAGPAAEVVSTATTGGSALLQLSSLPELILDEVVPAVPLIHDWI
ncbi:hypothetical protein [Streptomyces nitrosporeus]|uniref:Uncharacterized protein n=1 Tax=Streptomyces nitrosporeus TaxID=28894 RepID=A0A5J6FFI5_9ACTN|nr:hypothetical protein [Streptomyces nitrosporeus]QEU73715.1 hypothetical protein CP967_18470 [Streptomyces nitrosporeus]GGZ11905.1 hypothetical protein GCM10010327_48310 [Streptomyces nitrosporeus]